MPVCCKAADVIVRLRRMLDLYANIRPAKSFANMPALRDDIDLVIVRENTCDLFFLVSLFCNYACIFCDSF